MSCIRGPYVRFGERDDMSEINSHNPTRFIFTGTFYFDDIACNRQL